MRKIALQSLHEKSLKFRNNFVSNFVNQESQTLRDFQSLYGPLVENQRQNRLAAHGHFLSNMHRRPNSDLCCMIARGNDGLNFSSVRTREFRLRGHDVQKRQQHPPMLVDVGEVIDELEQPSLRFVVRLQSLDLCNSIWRHPVQAMPPKFAFESTMTTANRELMFFSGYIIRSKHQSPHQIVKGRPHVLQAVSDPKRNGKRNGDVRLNPGNKAICIGLSLPHNSCRFVAKVPANIGSKDLKLSCGPSDFLLNGVERRHSSNIARSLRQVNNPQQPVVS